MLKFPLIVPQQMPGHQITGVPKILDGNTLWFVDEAHAPFRFYKVDLSKTRMYATPVQEDEIPKPVEFEAVTLDHHQMMFGLWLTYEAQMRSHHFLPAGRMSSAELRASEVNTSDFRWAVEHRTQKVTSEDTVGYRWRITEEFLAKCSRMISDQEEILTEERNRNKEFTGELSLDEAMKVLQIFTFNGDKKKLIQVLKEDWNLDLKDSDVKVGTFGSMKINLPLTIEELVISSRDKVPT